MRPHFRFESLRVWQQAIQLNTDLFFLVEEANRRKNYAFTSQLQRALLSISNNIAEGSGSVSKKEFANFLNMSHRSAFECVSMLYVARNFSWISEADLEKFIARFDELCRQTEGLRMYLLKKQE